ncbi:MAG: hypothetical protein WC470_02715 [Candidatus Paceibacterota bacterium]
MEEDGCILKEPSKEIEDITYMLFSPPNNGGLGKRKHYIYCRLVELFKNRPDLIWAMLKELQVLDGELLNREVDFVKSGHDCVRMVFNELGQHPNFQARKFKRIFPEMKKWPQSNFGYIFAETAFAVLPNSKAETYNPILNLNNKG